MITFSWLTMLTVQQEYLHALQIVKYLTRVIIFLVVYNLLICVTKETNLVDRQYFSDKYGKLQIF